MTDTKELTKCRICGSTSLRQLLCDCKTDSGHSYSLVQCANCSFVTIHPIPSEETLKQYYDENYWHRDKANVNKGLNVFLSLRMRPILNGIKKLAPPPARVLDWGAGDGRLFHALTKAGYDCWGIDIYSTELANNRLTNTTIEKCCFSDEFFDAITCIHVLEHINNPLKSIERALGLLKADGILVLEVPNIQSLGSKVFGKKWQPLQVPTHLNHFTLKSLQKLFDMLGNGIIIKLSTFSHRVSPSSTVQSIFPSMAPRVMRKTHQGKYPSIFMFIYFLFQVLAYPFAIVESALKRGAVIRIFVRKSVP